MKSLLGRFRYNRLASTFTILATLSAGILVGSVVAHNVRACRTSSTASSAARVAGRRRRSPTAAAASARPSAPASSSTPRLHHHQQPRRRQGRQDLRQALHRSRRRQPPARAVPPPSSASTRDRHRRHQDRHQDPAAHRQARQLRGAQVGDWVLAIGSPFGLSQTVSAGIVSAKNRSIDEPRPQPASPSSSSASSRPTPPSTPATPAARWSIWPANVVGMNTAIYTQSMGSQGVGFAMPSNILAKVYNDLIGPEHKVIRGSIGISSRPPILRRQPRLRLLQRRRHRLGVTPNGGAAKAGIKPGDIIVSIDGHQIKDGDDLVATSPPASRLHRRDRLPPRQQAVACHRHHRRS
jgi:hypothetical protein